MGLTVRLINALTNCRMFSVCIRPFVPQKKERFFLSFFFFYKMFYLFSKITTIYCAKTLVLLFNLCIIIFSGDTASQIKGKEVRPVSSNSSSKGYIFIAHFTDKNGVTHYAKDHGKKAFRIPRKSKTKRA